MDEKFVDLLKSVSTEIFDDPAADLLEDGIIDSLKIMQIVSGFESEYGIDFDPEDILPENFSSAEAMWALLQKYLTEKTNAS